LIENIELKYSNSLAVDGPGRDTISVCYKCVKYMHNMGELIELVPLGKYHHSYDYGYEYVNESHTEEEKKRRFVPT
jgi:hypothetical protein